VGIDADSHELIPGDGESAPVAPVAGTRPERQLSRIFVRQAPVPEPPLDELASQRCIHHPYHLLVSVHAAVAAVQTCRYPRPALRLLPGPCDSARLPLATLPRCAHAADWARGCSCSQPRFATPYWGAAGGESRSSGRVRRRSAASTDVPSGPAGTGLRR